MDLLTAAAAVGMVLQQRRHRNEALITLQNAIGKGIVSAAFREKGVTALLVKCWQFASELFSFIFVALKTWVHMR